MPLRKTGDTRPQISSVSPAAAIPGGELQVRGKNFGGDPQPKVSFGETAGHLVIGSDSLLIVRVPDGVSEKQVTVGHNGNASAPVESCCSLSTLPMLFRSRATSGLSLPNAFSSMARARR